MKKLILILAVAALPMAAFADATPPAKKKTHKAHTTASPAPSPSPSPSPKASPAAK